MGFAARSLLLLSVLYSLVFVVGDFALLHRQAPVWVGILFVVVLASAQFLLSPLTSPLMSPLTSSLTLPLMRMRALNRGSVGQRSMAGGAMAGGSMAGGSMGHESMTPGQRAADSLPHGSRPHRISFPAEFLLWAAPLACAILIAASLWTNREEGRFGVASQSHGMPWLLVALGVTWAVRIGFRYSGSFQRSGINNLLEDTGVSQLRPRAVEIEGEIVSRGIPGAFWSPDLMVKDETGSMFLYFRSSIPLGRLFFAFHSANRFVGERVRLQGWYRRGLQPYIELACIEAVVTQPAEEEGSLSVFRQDCEKLKIRYEILSERSYSRWIQLTLSAACAAAGVIWLLGGF